jgi:hypothetical protein
MDGAQLVLAVTTKAIDLSHLNQGTYFLSLYNAGKIAASAVLVKE